MTLRIFRPAPGTADGESELVWNRADGKQVVYRVLRGVPPVCPTTAEIKKGGRAVLFRDYQQEPVVAFDFDLETLFESMDFSRERQWQILIPGATENLKRPTFRTDLTALWRTSVFGVANSGWNGAK